MNVLAHLFRPALLAALAAPSLVPGDSGSDSGARTLVGAAVVLTMIAIVIGAGAVMDRGSRA
jgi:hypothetical protein